MNEVSTQSNWRVDTDEENIAWLCFDKEGAGTNVLSGHVMIELEEHIRRLEETEPKAVILYSAKKNGFVAGADIKEFTGLETPAQAFDLIRRGQLVMEKLAQLPCPTIALVHGFALGGGLELALACDYRIAADDANTAMGLPEVKLGIHPGFGGTVRSIYTMGVIPAMDIMLTGRSLRAKQALATGLVDKIVPLAELKQAGREMALNPPAKRKAGLGQRLLNIAFIRPFVANILVKRVSAKARKEHYPAPFAIIDLWKRHWGGDMYMAEANSIAELMCGETARNLVRVFLLQDKLKGLGNKKMLDLKHVHVIGAGVMGGDIASWCALRGYTVSLQDREMQYIEPALKRAEKLFSKKLRTPQDIEAAKKRLTADTEGKGVENADVVIEAIFENVEAKQDLYKNLEPRMRKDAVLATNTSSIRLEVLNNVLENPARLVGLHFFNPVAMMPLVEVIHTDNTDEAMLNKALAFTRHIDRLPVSCKSSPGFLVNRILMPYLMEAVTIAEEGVAIEAIDYAAVKFGMPMGPVELSDTVGLDVCLSVAKILSAEFNTPVPRRLTRMVEEKNIGRKSGRGFYQYVDGKPVKDKKKKKSGPQDIEDRLIYLMLNEAVACLEEGIVENADLLDAGVTFGTGFAPFRGGPINYIRSQGPKKLLARLQALHDKYGDRFQPHAGWNTL